MQPIRNHGDRLGTPVMRWIEDPGIATLRVCVDDDVRDAGRVRHLPRRNGSGGLRPRTRGSERRC